MLTISVIQGVDYFSHTTCWLFQSYNVLTISVIQRVDYYSHATCWLFQSCNMLTISVIQRVDYYSHTMGWLLQSYNVLTITVIQRVDYFSNTTIEAIGIQQHLRVYYLITLLQLNSPPVLSGDHVTRSLVLYVCFVEHCLSFCTFSLAIVLFVFLRFTDSDYPFGIFKHFYTYILTERDPITKQV